MASRILVPYDGSDLANEALRFAFESFPDATIEIFYVVEPFAAHTDAGVESGRKRWQDKAEEYANDVFESALSVANEFDTAVETEWRYGRPGHVIVSHLDDGDYDHVVMGSHGRSGVERLLLGSVAEMVVRRASIPVTIISVA